MFDALTSEENTALFVKLAHASDDLRRLCGYLNDTGLSFALAADRGEIAFTRALETWGDILDLQRDVNAADGIV
jgi:hypothetical protein